MRRTTARRVRARIAPRGEDDPSRFKFPAAEKLLPSGPALPVPVTVVRARATAGTVFALRLREGGVRVAARGLVFAGGRSVDLAPRTVTLGAYPP